jgi:uncharacterized sulfatase
MKNKLLPFIEKYAKATLALAITIIMTRVYEYFFIASKSFVKHALLFELTGWVFDIWMCLIYASILILPLFILSLISKPFSILIYHGLNTVLIIAYISLIMVFSERNTPFDHEIITRSFSESWTTAKQMMTSGITVFLPFLIYISFYFIITFHLSKSAQLKNNQIVYSGMVALLALVFMSYANPSENKFEEKKAYYLTSNKVTYLVIDLYHFMLNKSKFDATKLSDEELKEAIAFYQKNQAFEFTNPSYPLLHKNNSHDVLGGFFNLDKNSPPNIVLLVVEGLSRDFSGDKAYAGSFTPFLDKLSKKSLVWDNFLSTAPGTFAAQPALTGSVPYGDRGFSVINVMPNHLSLIKILRSNGYHTKFLIGFNPDFDNMGGYMRLQGTDMILTKYGSKYKMMGIGAEGWTMGYPDDALYNRGFEVLDSINKTPYLNIYHTGTTHMPYLFDQKEAYGKLFDQKLKLIPDAATIKKTLKETKQVLVTYMFSDDCIKNFFDKYEKRPEYKNTIFIITGDHHIGSFPSTGGIDDYHVPLIVYSPMLNEHKKFYSVNSHNNIAPTISALILNNYPNLKNKPKEVPWMADVMDTSVQFRNKQSMPFMEWSREMTDYIYKDYYLSGNQLYKLTPDLLEIKVENDSVKNHMVNLLNNFKLINDLVCSKNLLYPNETIASNEKKEILLDYFNPKTQNIITKLSDSSILPEINISKTNKYIYVEVSADINLLLPGTEDQPSFRLSMIDTTNHKRNFLFWTNHNIIQMTKKDFVEKQWNTTSTNDLFTIADYKKSKSLVFDLSFFSNVKAINLQMRNLRVKIVGIK